MTRTLARSKQGFGPAAIRPRKGTRNGSSGPDDDQPARFARLAILPVEIICNILAYLEYADLCECKSVCKQFKALVSTTSALQYITELHKHRMVSVLPHSNATPTSASLLKLLLNRESNWRRLSWRARCLVPLPPTGSLYEFVGGVYANGREGENRVTASISFVELPSVGIPGCAAGGNEVITANDQLRKWTHVTPEWNIIDFTMDPVQDLLVLVVVAPPDSPCVYDLHIRSIRTNQPHPKAPAGPTGAVFPCLARSNLHPHPVEIVTAVRVQVCGDLVALLIKDVFDNSGGYLEIWNWHFGPTRSCKMPRTGGIDDFTFLTREVCLIVRPTGRFEVYDFEDPMNSASRDDDEDGPESTSSEPVMRYAFAFPTLTPGFTYWYISLSSNPTPGYVPSAPAEAKKDEDHEEPFLNGHPQIHYPKPEERVHACCLYVFNPAEPVLQAVTSFVFFVKISSLLNPPVAWFQRPEEWLERQEEMEETWREEQKNSLRGAPIPYYNRDAWERRWAREEKERARARARGKTHNRGKAKLEAVDIKLTGFPGLLDASSLPMAPLNFGDYDGLNPIPAFEPTGLRASQSSQSSTSSSSSQPSSSSSAAPPPDPAQCAPVPWEVWGPSSTRWFEEALSTDWQHAIYGMRAVESVEVSKMREERREWEEKMETRRRRKRRHDDWERLRMWEQEVVAERSGFDEEAEARGDWGGEIGESYREQDQEQERGEDVLLGRQVPPSATPWPSLFQLDPSASTTTLPTAIPDTTPTIAATQSSTIAAPAPVMTASTSTAATPATATTVGTPATATTTTTMTATTALVTTEDVFKERRFLRMRDFSRLSLDEAAGVEAWEQEQERKREKGRVWSRTPSPDPHSDWYAQRRPSSRSHGIQLASSSSSNVASTSTNTNLRFGYLNSKLDKRFKEEAGQGDPVAQTVRQWCAPRLVATPSTVCVNGVFTHDIVSALPYVETVTNETFEVTDVMMDDSRLLLLKRSSAGKINQMEVLLL